MRVEFFVHGRPQPQGSTKAFMPKGARFPVVTSDNAKLKPWRQEIAGVALREMSASLQSLEFGPVHVQCEFAFQRPKSTSKKVTHKITRPDLDKCLRGVYDALTGIVFYDDAQIVSSVESKVFAEKEGVWILVQSV